MRSRTIRAFRATLPAVVLAAVLLATHAGPAAAQVEQDVLSGRVLREGEPVAGVPVTLHRVTAGASGEAGTAVTDASGRFRFRLPPPDSAGFTVLFTTAEYASVRHFGPPLHPDEPAVEYTVAVYDTATSLPGAIRVARRDLVLLPGADGGWEVNEILRVRNDARRTLVGRDGMPVWSVALPGGATDFEVGEGDLAADQVRQMEDRALLMAPLTPGERDLFFRYRIPAASGRAALELDSPADSVNVYVQQPAPHVDLEGLTPAEVLTVEGQRFLRFAGADLAEGQRIEVRWDSGQGPVSPVLAAVGVTALVLGVGGAAALRNRGSRAA